MQKTYYIYIVASKRNGSIYTGVTSDITRRIYEHKNKLIEGFTKDNNITMLVYLEETGDIVSAIAREKEIKHWKRAWRIALIEKDNPQWKDLSLSF
jgi:putative endonuclease